MAAKRSSPLCVLVVGYQRLILPMPAGLECMKLLQHAHTADWKPGRGNTDRYELEAPLEVKIESIRHDQVSWPIPEVAPARPVRKALAAPVRQLRPPSRGLLDDVD